jgi:hypothetical protein
VRREILRRGSVRGGLTLIGWVALGVRFVVTVGFRPGLKLVTAVNFLRVLFVRAFFGVRLFAHVFVVIFLTCLLAGKIVMRGFAGRVVSLIVGGAAVGERLSGQHLHYVRGDRRNRRRLRQRFAVRLAVIVVF